MFTALVSDRRGYWREMARHRSRLRRNSEMKTISRCSWDASSDDLSWGRAHDAGYGDLAAEAPRSRARHRLAAVRTRYRKVNQ